MWIVMIFVRCLVLACLNFNILFRARHVAGVKNILADSLSRLHVSDTEALLYIWRSCSRQKSVEKKHGGFPFLRSLDSCC